MKLFKCIIPFVVIILIIIGVSFEVDAADSKNINDQTNVNTSQIKDIQEELDNTKKEVEELKNRLDSTNFENITAYYTGYEGKMSDRFDSLIGFINIYLVIVIFVLTFAAGYGSFWVPRALKKDLNMKIVTFNKQILEYQTKYDDIDRKNEALNKKIVEMENKVIENIKAELVHRDKQLSYSIRFIDLNTTIESKKYKKAIARIDKYLNKEDDIAIKSALLRLKAYNLYKIGEDDEALKIYQYCLSINGQDSISKYNIGTILYRIGDYKGCKKVFDELIEYDELNGDYYNYRGSAYMNLDEYEKSLDDLDKCVNLDSEDEGAYHSRADLYLRMKNYKFANDDCNKALFYNSNYIPAYITLAEIAVNEEGQENKMYEALGNAIKIEKGEACFLINSTDSFNKYQHTEEFIKLLNCYNCDVTSCKQHGNIKSLEFLKKHKEKSETHEKHISDISDEKDA